MSETKRTRRAPGEGAVYLETFPVDPQTGRPKRRPRWVGQVDLGDGPDGKRRRVKVTGTTKTEVRLRLEELRRNQTTGLPVPSGDRLSEHLDWWVGTLDAKAATGSKSVITVDNAKWAVEAWIRPALGSVRLRDLQPEDVEQLLAKMATAGKSRRSITRVRSYLGQALATAERRGKVARNVARLSEMPATKAPAERQSLTPDQAKRLLEAIRGDRLEALFAMGLMLGMRPGELLGLSWADVDLRERRLVVEQALRFVAGPVNPQTGRPTRRLARGKTKTPRSRRPLTIPGPVAEALRDHRRRQLEEQLLAGSAWQSSGLVFTNEVGGPIDPANLRRSFRRVAERAQLGRWTPNELRHSAASLLSAAGVPLEVIADVLGHASTRMLEQHYRHQVKPSIDAHVSVMEALFGSPAGTPLGTPNPGRRVIPPA